MGAVVAFGLVWKRVVSSCVGWRVQRQIGGALPGFRICALPGFRSLGSGVLGSWGLGV